MTSIPVPICRFPDNNFKYLYLKKKKTSCGIFITFLKYIWNLEHFEKKEKYSSLIITEIIASERDVYWSV